MGTKDQSGPDQGQAARAARLAAALRQNLARRKAQARSRAAEVGDEVPEGETPTGGTWTRSE